MVRNCQGNNLLRPCPLVLSSGGHSGEEGLGGPRSCSLVGMCDNPGKSKPGETTKFGLI